VHEGRAFGIDVFGGALAGLVLAELALDSEAELRALPLPGFAHCEVTELPLFTGGELVREPEHALREARRRRGFSRGGRHRKARRGQSSVRRALAAGWSGNRRAAGLLLSDDAFCDPRSRRQRRERCWPTSAGCRTTRAGVDSAARCWAGFLNLWHAAIPVGEHSRDRRRVYHSAAGRLIASEPGVLRPRPLLAAIEAAREP
jgi:hypothetical protein